MSRALTSLCLLLALVSVSSASLHTYHNSSAPTPDVFTMVGSGDFSLADTPWYSDASSTRYLATSGFSVIANGTAGAQQFDLYDAEIWPMYDQVTLEFRNATYGKLWIDISAPGVVLGQTVPATSPANNFWKTASYSDGAGVLNGFLPDSYLSAAAVPEPSAFLFGGLALGFVGVGRWFRRRRAV